MNPETRATTAKSELKEVLYAWNYLEWGGAQIYFLGLASRLKAEASVKFIVPRGTSQQFLDFCRERGITVEFVEIANDLSPAPTIASKLKRHWRKFRSEVALLRKIGELRKQGTLVHVDLAPWQSLCALLWLVLRGPVFMTMHNALPSVSHFRRLIWKSKFAVASRLGRFHIFASNADARDGLRDLVTRSFFDRVEVTYTNVNPDEIDLALSASFDANRELTRLGVPSGRFMVMCLGQFIDRKGRWIFLEAARAIAETDDEVNFVWISNSVLRPDELEKIRSFGLDGKFFLLRSEDVSADHAGLLRFLRAADVFVLPSYVEGLPISLLEAMALGIPSISTAVYAIPEALIDDETGVLIPAGDAKALAAAITRLRANRQLRESLAAKGREHVLAKFNEKAVAELATAAYRRALNG